MRNKEKQQFISYLILPVIGILFTIMYIASASVDVVYSDYIRIINEYLRDVTDISRLLVPDILTRIPMTYLARLVNVLSFGYSVTFDRALCVIGLAVMVIFSARYLYRHEISFRWQLAFYIVLFSLNKWEILLNGTSWPHLVSFGLFFAGYWYTDLVWNGEADGREELLLCSFPIIMLLFAGEYIVSYACTMMLICGMGLLLGGANSMAGKREQAIFKRVLIVSAIALLLYMLSRHFAVWEHAGATDQSLIQTVMTEPKLLPKFLIKSFAGMVFGKEVIDSMVPGGAAMPNKLVLLIGCIVMLGYLLAIVLYFQNDILEHTVFPLILIISGGANHVLVMLARWIFLRDDYALSSRYGAQFMVGILGIILVFAMFNRQRRPYRRVDEKRRNITRALAGGLTILIVLGNCYTDYRELRIARYRKANYRAIAEALIDYEQYDEAELVKLLEWHKDPAELYSAIEILKDNKLNVFSTPKITDGASGE